MPGLPGKVAFITGLAVGQGRSHAIRLANSGVDIIDIDICQTIPTARSQESTAEDLADTGAAVKSTGRRVIAGAVDVRDFAGMTAFVNDAVTEFGRVDIVIANAGSPVPRRHSNSTSYLADNLDINLTRA